MGAGAGGAGLGAAGFFGAAAFFGAAVRAFAFLADFFATARFAFLRAGAAFFAFPFLVFDFAFFAFLAIIDSRRCGSDLGTYCTLDSHIATTVSPAAAATLFPASPCGAHPPVAQSIS